MLLTSLLANCAQRFIMIYLSQWRATRKANAHRGWPTIICCDDRL